MMDVCDVKDKKVKIGGFRGFTRKTPIEPIEFENPVTLLYGGNHQGKSSILNAIEWCLYGDECISEKSGIRERVGTGEIAWRVVNDSSEKAQVKLKIEREQGVLLLSEPKPRERAKKGKA
ncbi:MAG: hypothetical protein B5M48_01375 [Candidatus Omnitrophica bacterium 4484_213]|nr:MAG: hypothetical protein B5M48_01375 [Candidatus Omnitrophica bacterium 4484_213]